MKTFRLRLNLGLWILSLAYFLPLQSVYAESISGHIEADAKNRAQKIIVYLQAQSDADHRQSETHQVSQKDTRFKPPLTVVTVGDSVQWINNESKEIDHNIYSLSENNRFDLGLGAKNSKLEQVFKQVGEVNYYCSVHKSMEGKVVVLPSRYYQILEKPGDFKFDDIPQGKWLLKAIVFHRRYKIEPVSLTLDKTPLQNLTLKLVKR